MPNRKPIIVCVAFAFATGACSDTSAPRITPALLARHIDSLSTATDTGVNGVLRAQILEDLEVPPALGAAPVAVQVTTPSGQQHWEGFAYRDADYGPGLGIGNVIDSAYFVVAYSDYALDVVVEAELVYTDTYTHLFVFLMDSGQIMLGGQGSLVATTTSTGGNCVLAPGLQNHLGGLVSNCALAAIQASVSYTFTPRPAQIPAYQSITIAPQSFNGVDLK